MEGYVRNISPTWKHALKRSMSPGSEIALDVLYAEYGEKHGIKEGQAFVNWLRDVKLKDRTIWEINYTSPKTSKIDEVEESTEDTNIEEIKSEEKPKSEEKLKNDNINPFVEKKIDINDVVNLSVRAAREVLPKIVDIKLLKHALNIVKTQANKDTLTILLRKRLKELELAARR